ncbi:MAG: hypothetical protein IKC52_01465 [Clostridia bacterium]|nr:hypothetical protein [Clostridia bacterium]
MKTRQTCTRCVNDTTVKKIKFNKDGLCSHCSCYDKYKPLLKDYNRLEKLFLHKISNPGQYDYDVAMGFSGGKDSTYVLYQLVKHYKLKVKAYTLDNGFLSAEAKSKIDKIVKELGVEHEYVVCNEEVLKATYKHVVSRYLSPCIACSFLGYAVMINYASKVNARVGMHGRSTYQMFRGLSDSHDDVFRPFVDAGLQEDVDLDALYGEIIGKIDSLVDKKLAKQIKEQLLCDAQRNGYREFVSYFLYHPYDHVQIVDFLQRNTSWHVETDVEHFDCLIHNGALYIKNLVARRSHLMPEFSVMVNEGIITKEQAIGMLKQKPNEKIAKKELKLFCKFAGLSYNWTMFKAIIYSKRWW